MTLAYRPPGVSVQEDVSTTIAPLLSAPALICLIGPTQGYQTKTDRFTLAGTEPTALPSLPAGATLGSVVSVKDALNPSKGAADGSGYLLTTDYTVAGNANETQLVTITGTPTGGTFTLTFNGSTTAPIAYNATASAVQTALQALASIGSGNATVAGSGGGPYTVTFVGTFANTNVPIMTKDTTGLTGGTSPNIAISQGTQGSSAGSIVRNGGGTIADPTLVDVTYTYTDVDYFRPTRLFDVGSVESRFGAALKSDGTINSPVSYAATIAFENGVGSVVIQALLKRATPGNPLTAATQPSSTDIATVTSWSDTLYLLRDVEDINVVIPIVGQSTTGVTDSVLLSIFQACQDHTEFMKNEDQFIIDIFGEDSSKSSSVATQAIVQSHANTLRGRYGGDLAEQTVLINTTKFPRALPASNQTIEIGGQYVAAALGGMLASRPVSSSLTRKFISGFIGVDDYRSKQMKNDDAAAGLLVIDQNGQNVLVRHSITLDQTSSASRELSVVRAKHRTIESVRTTLDTQIVGQIIADGNSTTTVSATVTAVLEQLRTNNDLVEYSAVESRLLSLDPTTIQVRFSYRPAFPVNYIDVVFSLDLTSGTVTTVAS